MFSYFIKTCFDNALTCSTKAVDWIHGDRHVFHLKQRDNHSLQRSMIMRRGIMAACGMNGRGGAQCRR